MHEKKCGTCGYGMYCGPISVACHRYPPTITKAEGNEVTTYFPIMSPDTWCGEYKPGGSGSIRSRPKRT